MARVRLVHWKPDDAKRLIELLHAAGHRVDYDEKFDLAYYRQNLPDALVIDLSRVPSHGREVAIYLRGRKSTRHIPIVFVDGAPEKVEATRLKLPDAIYATSSRLRSALARALKDALPKPVVPQMMERYAERGAARKLGIRESSTVALIDPPRNYAKALGDLPANVQFNEDASEPCSVTLWFVHDPETYLAELPRRRALAEHSKLWILWTKRAARNSGMSGNFVRDAALSLGLVDYKICSYDETWSGMLFARKKTSR